MNPSTPRTDAGAPRASGATVQSVTRTLDLLETLGREGALGVVELAARVGLAQGTAHRLLTTLAERGYVRQDGERRYHLGLAATRLADRAQRELTVLAMPHLRALVDEVGETANLAVLDGGAMTYVAQAPSPHTLRIFAEVGRQVPIHSTAVGKAVLAGLPAQEAQHLIAGFAWEARTPHTLMTAEDLATEVASVTAQGYAVDEQEQEIGVRCVAVALPSADLHAAISVSGPAERFIPEAAVAAARHVRAAADAVGARLR